MSNPNNNDYRRKMKELRRYVSFNYDLRKPLHSSQKAKINRYYKELKEIKNELHREYRPRNKKKLKALVKASGFSDEFKIVPIIESPENQEYSIGYINGEIIFQSKYEKKVFYGFNMRALAENPEKEIDRVLNKIDADLIAITYGKFESPRSNSKEFIKQDLMYLINAYQETYKKWLQGLFSIKFKNQEKMPKALQVKGNKKLGRKNGKKKNSNW